MEIEEYHVIYVVEVGSYTDSLFFFLFFFFFFFGLLGNVWLSEPGHPVSSPDLPSHGHAQKPRPTTSIVGRPEFARR